MDRITKRCENGKVWFAIDGTSTENLLRFSSILNRLAEYEDTGLTPEEIRVLQEYHDLHTHEDVEASRYVLNLIEVDKKNRIHKADF